MWYNFGMGSSFKVQFRNKLFLFFGLVIFFVVGFYFLAKETTSLADSIAKDRVSLLVGSNVSQVLADLKGGKAAAVPYQKGIKALLPTRDQIVSNLSQSLDSQARISGVTMTFAFQGEEVKPEASQLGNVGFSLKLVGPVGNLVDFFNYLETKAPGFLMRFDHYDLSRTGEDYQLALKGVAFYQ
jgi:hypothetical protein